MKCDAKHARTAHHQESAPSHEKYLALGLLRGELFAGVVGGPAALRLLTHAPRGPAGASAAGECSTHAQWGKRAARDVPRLARHRS